MSYRGVLVDRAVRIYTEPGEIDPATGERSYEEKRGKSFRCRLSPPESTENRGEDTATREVTTGTLLLDRDVYLDSGDRVEITSKELGSGTWMVVGDRNMFRRRRIVIGSSVQVRKVANN